MDTKPIYDYPTRETILLATSYYHITLTVPHHGRPPCRGGGVKAPMTRKISKMHKLGANQVPTNLLRTVIVHFTRLTYWLISGSNADFGFAAPYSFITVYLWLHSCLRNLWLLNFLEMCIGLEWYGLRLGRCNNLHTPKISNGKVRALRQYKQISTSVPK